jgi:hypothetical protein
MNTVTDKFLVCIELATELGGIFMKQVTFKTLNFMFLKPEHAEEFMNRIRTMVMCTVVSTEVDLVTVKLFE